MKYHRSSKAARRSGGYDPDALISSYDLKADEVSSVKKAVLDAVKPHPAERARLEEARERLLKEVAEAAAGLGETEVYPVPVGSAARSTWLRGNHDIDIFITFPETLSKEELTVRGCAIAEKLAETADHREDRHSEHPYIHIRKYGFEIDLVPCFRVPDASCIKSAVDRTPFHCRFIKERIAGREDDVLLLKQFMKGAGVYGSEVRNRGFSGYASELLVIFYGSFDEVIKAAAQWKPGVFIDIMDHGNVSFDDPLVMIDPTDPGRNVSAALSLDRFMKLADHARAFIRRPDVSFFFREKTLPYSDEEILSVFEKRGTYFTAIRFRSPKKADDTLYPQLFRMENSVRETLENNDFKVIRTLSYGDDEECVILIELLSGLLPPVRVKDGPPVSAHPNSDAFRKKYVAAGDTYSIFIRNGCYIAEIPRRYRTPESVIRDKTGTEIALGKHIREALSDGWDILSGEEILKIGSEGFRTALRETMERTLPERSCAGSEIIIG